MESCGWEIRPAERVLLLALAIAVIYFVGISSQRTFNKNPQQPL